MAADEDGSPNDRDDRTGGRAGLPPGIAKKGFIPPGIEKQEDNHKGHVTARSHTRIDLGSSNATVTLHGNHITVIGQNGTVAVSGTHATHDTIRLGDGPDQVNLSGTHNKVKLGNGNDHVTLDGNHNITTVGTGTNTIDLSANSHHDIVTVGSGHDTITTSGGDSANTFRLDDSTSSLVLHGTDNKVFVNGGTDNITDSASKLDQLLLNIGSLGGTVDITNFSAAHGLVDLAPDLGFVSGAAAAMAVTPDGSGGSLLTFASGLGSIDFHGVAPASLHAANFHIT